MKLGDRIKQLREQSRLTQAQLAACSSVSQGYLSQLENGEVKSPSAAVLLRLAQAMHEDPNELFEAAGYPTVRTLRRIYKGYESTIDADLLEFLTRLPRERQRRLLSVLQELERLLEGAPKPGSDPEDEWPHKTEARRGGKIAVGHSGRKIKTLAG